MGLIAYYPFKNGSLENLVGVGGNANNNGALFNNTLGKDSYYFNNGSTTYINHLGINIPQVCSFSAWNYQTNTSGQMLFYVYDGGGFVGVYFSGINIYWNIGDGSNNPFRKNGVNVTAPTLNQWHYYVITCSTTEIMLYIDGIYVGSAITYRNPSRANIVIGNYYSLSGYPNSGYIANFRIYNHTLSPTEVTDLYKNNSSENNVSLIAHYPLNGNTDDYSGNGFNATNSGATIDNNGKIGKCYSFTTSSLTLNSPIDNFTNLTISFWMLSSQSNVAVISENTTNFNANNSYMFWTNEATVGKIQFGYNSTIYTIVTSTTTVNDGKWHHICGCISKKSIGFIISLYVDGVLNASTTTTNPYNYYTSGNIYIGSRASTSYFYNGKINDFRIYNGVLSPKEIKEIAKAKILHYNFNDFQEPTINLDNPTQMLNPMGHGLTYNYLGLDNGWQKYSISGTKPVGDNYPYTFYINCTKDLLSGNKQSMRFKMKCNCLEKYGQALTGTVDNIVWDSATITYLPSTPNKSNIVYDYLVENLSHHEVNLQHQPFYLFSYGIEGVSFNPATDFIWLKDHQTEDKDHSTNYTPTSRTGQVQDSSGYKNHADILATKTPQWTEFSKIGTGCYYWGTDKIRSITQSINVPTDAITMNCWFKVKTPTTAGFTSYHIPMAINSSYHEMSISSSGALRVGFYLSGTRYVDDHGSGLLDGNWHMLTTVYDGTSKKGYIDGVLVGNIATGGTLTSGTQTLRIGEYSNNDYGNKDAYQDDVRIYATALSQEDITELYEVGQQIHNTGILETNEVIENGYYHNLIQYNKWVVGDFVYQDGWNNHWGSKPTQYSDLIALYSNPQGEQDLVYESKVLDNTFVMYRTRGLAATPTILPDITKKYRLSYWVYISGNTTSGTIWHAGLDYYKVCNINTTTPDGNPYPHILGGGVSTGDKWILCVSYIYPYGSVGNTNNAKHYLPDGTIHSTGTDYNWNSGISSFFLRWLFNYQYDQPNVNQYTLLYRPRFDLIDGTEPTLQELLKCQDHKPFPLIQPEFSEKHYTYINKYKEAFTTGITFIRDDNEVSQQLYCDYFEGEVYAKTLSGTFVVKGTIFTTIAQKIDINQFYDRVVVNMDNNIIYVNKLIEN